MSPILCLKWGLRLGPKLGSRFDREVLLCQCPTAAMGIFGNTQCTQCCDHRRAIIIIKMGSAESTHILHQTCRAIPTPQTRNQTIPRNHRFHPQRSRSPPMLRCTTLIPVSIDTECSFRSSVTPKMSTENAFTTKLPTRMSFHIPPRCNSMQSMSNSMGDTPFVLH